MYFSIICPVYNAEHFLPTCLHSVQGQSFSDWELLLVDDGSTDGSAALLAAEAAADPRLRLLRQENMGQLWARRTGIAAARGEYLLFLDSDDHLAPGCLERLHRELTAQPTDLLLYTGAILMDGRETGRFAGHLLPEARELSPRWLRERLLSTHELNSLCLKVFRRTLFAGDGTDYGPFRGRCCGEDKAQLLYPVTRARRIRYIPDALYCYEHRPDSVMHTCQPEDIHRMLSGELFTLLRSYLPLWQMEDKTHLELYWVYYLRNYITVYYNVRKRCAAGGDLRPLRRYPWQRDVDRTAAPYAASRLLSAREKCKLLAAMLRL